MGGPNLKRQKYWKAHVEAFRSSGLSQHDYCRKFHIKAPTLRSWRLRFGVKSGEPAPKPSQLMPVTVVDSRPSRVAASLHLIIERAGAVEVRGDLDAIAELVRMLRGGIK